jgi:O-6-methylguanine DNA methyltransferase
MEEPAKWVPFETPFGTGWIGVTSGSVQRILLPGSGGSPGTLASSEAAAGLADELSAYFCGSGPLPDGSRFLDAAAATPLDAAIYRTVIGIPSGQTMTYAQVAESAQRPRAARAVGAAMAKNRFAPAIPCHRVVGSDGSLRGYAGGIEMKRALLEMEASYA